MTRVPAVPACRRPGPPLVAVAALLALGIAAMPARAGAQALQFSATPLPLPALPPREALASRGADDLPLYERAPMPDESTLAPLGDGAAADPLQPSVINRGGNLAESGGYLRNSSVNAAQESRMKPGLGFALHVPTE